MPARTPTRDVCTYTLPQKSTRLACTHFGPGLLGASWGPLGALVLVELGTKETRIEAARSAAEILSLSLYISKDKFARGPSRLRAFARLRPPRHLRSHFRSPNPLKFGHLSVVILAALPSVTWPLISRHLATLPSVTWPLISRHLAALPNVTRPLISRHLASYQS